MKFSEVLRALRWCALAIGLGASLGGATAGEPSAEEILRHADALMAPPTFEAGMRMLTVRPDGTTRTFNVHLWKKGTEQLRVRFAAPPDDYGTEVLRDGENMWTYLPNLKRALRITPKQEFHGGDFSNTDILRMNLANDYTPKELPAQSPDEFLLELHAKNDTIAYDVIRYWIRKRDFMPLRQEFFTKSGKQIRQMEMLEPKAYGKLVRPSHLVMKNTLTPGRHSEVILDSFESKADLDGELFQLTSLGR